MLQVLKIPKIQTKTYLSLFINQLVMPTIKRLDKQEALSFEGIRLSDFLDKKFSDELKKEKLAILPASIVFIVKDKKEGKDIQFPLVLVHQSEEEFNNKILHLSIPLPNSESVIPQKFIKLLEKMG